MCVRASWAVMCVLLLYRMPELPGTTVDHRISLDHLSYDPTDEINGRQFQKRHPVRIDEGVGRPAPHAFIWPTLPWAGSYRSADSDSCGGCECRKREEAIFHNPRFRANERELNDLACPNGVVEDIAIQRIQGSSDLRFDDSTESLNPLVNCWGLPRYGLGDSKFAPGMNGRARKCLLLPAISFRPRRQGAGLISGMRSLAPDLEGGRWSSEKK
jgi:hypothetical protein